MFSRLTQRIIIITGILLAGYIWVLAVPALRAADGSRGVSLMSAGLDPARATGLALAAALPSAALVVLAAAWGRMNAGMFVAAVALCGAAIAGGPIDGWLWRAKLPGAYSGLIVEMLIWQAGIIGLWFIGRRLRRPIRRRMADPPPDADESHHFGLVSALATITSAAVAALAAWFLVRTSDSGQVLGGLAAAFAAGAFVARSIFPRATPLAIYLSPAFVAIAGYALVLARFTHGDQVLAAWYEMSALSRAAAAPLPPLALALPIHFASAGLAGCTIGVSLGRPDDEGPGNALSAMWRLVREAEGDKKV